MKKVAVALSGGVDSGVAAALLVKAGYQCAGFHLKLWSENRGDKGDRVAENKCCSTESLEAARKTAHQLKMPFYVLDFQEVFKKKVVNYFLAEYAAGNTPNPCVMCNRLIKFGELLNYVRKLGYDYLATGHYARITGDKRYEIRNRKYEIRNKKNNLSPISYRLLQACDESKDQSYFLYSLTQKQLAHVLFPVEDYLKKEVRAMARKWKLPVAHRPESQEICFFPETDYRPFLKRQISKGIKKGLVADTKGNIIGEHQGLPLYTIGQRHGFSISTKSEVRSTKLIPPFYVIDKNFRQNQLVVGFGKETEKQEFWVKNVNWIADRTKNKEHRTKGINCWVKIRHLGKLLKCKIQKAKGKGTSQKSKFNKIKVTFDEPERGIAPGQAAVFYRKYEIKSTKYEVMDLEDKKPKTKNQELRTNAYEVLGGGTITNF